MTDLWWKGDHAPSSLADIVPENARRTPDRVVLSRLQGKEWVPVTASRFRQEVEELALGFVSAGVQPGDRVALMSRTRYEWTLVDAALWAVGAVGVPVYETSSASQLEWILSDSAAVAAVVETRAHHALLEPVRDRVPHLRHHWTIEDVDGTPQLRDLVAAGAASGVDPAELDRRRAALTPDTLLTLIYTSGTTGRPKGCELTHGNFLAEVTAAIDHLPELFEDPHASTLLFLPLAHVFGRMIQVAVLLHGTHTGHTDIGRITRDLPSFAPTFVLAVPRVFERVFDTAQRKAVNSGKERVFNAAAATAVAYSQAMDAGGPGLLLSARRALFDRLVYRKIREAFGGRNQWAVSGGAALGARLGHFFRGIGVTVIEGYGLTETTAAATANSPRAMRIGSVGRALPGFELRIAHDGEVLVRGGHVFRGYWDNQEATAAAFDDEGWLHTGDLGRLDADGFLTITGRKKEILVTSGGKNVSPAPLEDIVRSSVLVSQAMVVGDGRPFIAALVTLDEESVTAWLEQNGRPATPLADLATDPAVILEVQKAVDAANVTVSNAERIKKFRILAVDFTEASGHLTPTLKLKRAEIMKDYQSEVDALYG
ncbi:MAG TPA: AMP-dependent synthetase/ligase [Actinomycetales bacterium]|nr:AMP-dependent synthetase/ligase [Actinomycetales bacterium]